MNSGKQSNRGVRDMKLKVLVPWGEGSGTQPEVFTLSVRAPEGNGANPYRLDNRKAPVAVASLRSTVEMARALETVADPLMSHVCFELAPILQPGQTLQEPLRGALRAALVVADRLARGVIALPQSVSADTELWLLASLSGPQARHWQCPDVAHQSALWQHLAAQSRGKAMVLTAQALDVPSGTLTMVLSPLSSEPLSLSDATVREATVYFAVTQSQQPAAICPLTVRLEADGGVSRLRDEVKVHNDYDTRKEGRTEDIKRFLKKLRLAEADRESDRHWLTHVVLPDLSFSQQSYELALALADRIARGREWVGPGRVFATGCVDLTPDMPGRVTTVANVHEGQPANSPDNKVHAFFKAAGPEDCIVLPHDWMLDQGIREHVDRGLREHRAGLGANAKPQVVYVKNVLSSELG